MDYTFNWNEIFEHFYKLMIAFALAMPIAWNREHKSRGAGLRTFPLVSLAACAYMLVGLEIYTEPDAQARVMYGIITGMGFIGGGAILKNKGSVVGTATASSIWNTGAIGISVAYGVYEVSILLSLTNFLILRYAIPLKRHDSDSRSKKRED
jgi:putative Mg2+ transporter-C (MgtC) family protein